MAFTPDDRKIIVAAAVVIFGGNVGSILNATSPDFRADPATGTDLRNMESHILSQAAKERASLKGEIIAQIHQEAYMTERECDKAKQVIRDRISIVEQNQKHCMRMLRQQHKGIDEE